MMTTRTRFKFECIIELPEDEDVQVSHLPEELQAYFDSYSNKIEVVSWKTKEVK